MERELSYLFKPGFPLAPVNLDHVPVGHLFDPLKVIHLVNDQASPYTEKTCNDQASPYTDKKA